MSRERALLVLAGALLVVAFGSVAALPGAVEQPSDPEPPGHLRVSEQVVAPGEISGETAELTVLTGLEHRRGAMENVTVRYRAIDAQSGLLTDEATVEVGTVDVDGERSVNGTLTVPREGSYELETVVYAGDERVARTTTQVSGVAALTPAYADSPVEFADNRVWPTVAVSVDSTEGNRTTLRLTASVTNRGDDASGALDLGVVLRQADSNVVAAREETTVSGIRPGRTDTVSLAVTVPSEYNYYVDVGLWQDDVLVDEHRTVANLDPQETIDANETRRDVAFEVDDFAGEDEPPGEERDREREVATEDATPGFGVAVAVAALLALALTRVVGRRR